MACLGLFEPSHFGGGPHSCWATCSDQESQLAWVATMGLHATILGADTVREKVLEPFAASTAEGESPGRGHQAEIKAILNHTPPDRWAPRSPAVCVMHAGL